MSQSLKLGIPKTTIYKVLHKRLKLQAYNLQVLQELKPDDFEERLNFAVKMLNKINVNQSFLDDVIFSDEATFHMNGPVNRQNSRIWGSEDSQDIF